jgi:hypothetical protein
LIKDNQWQFVVILLFWRLFGLLFNFEESRRLSLSGAAMLSHLSLIISSKALTNEFSGVASHFIRLALDENRKLNSWPGKSEKHWPGNETFERLSPTIWKVTAWILVWQYAKQQNATEIGLVASTKCLKNR